MADYGLRCKDASGVITLDTTDVIGRLVYKADVSAGVDGNSGTLSEISGKSTLELAIGIRNVTYADGCAHYVYRSGDIIYWEYQGFVAADHTYWYYMPSQNSTVLVWLID